MAYDIFMRAMRETCYAACWRYAAAMLYAIELRKSDATPHAYDMRSLLVTCFVDAIYLRY